MLANTNSCSTQQAELIMNKYKAQNSPHVPPTSEEFNEIMAGRMSISSELTEFWRQRTDDELANWFRDPTQWSYVLRSPDGEVVADGKAKGREECEEWAIRHAEDYTDENAMVVIHHGKSPPASLEEASAGDYSLDFR